jgi:hypothetical protein
VRDFLAQQSRTIVDGENDADCRKYGLLPLRFWTQAAAQVDPQRISGVGVENEANGSPEGVRMHVGTAHVSLLVLQGFPVLEQRSILEKVPLRRNSGYFVKLECHRIRIVLGVVGSVMAIGDY